MHTHRHDGYFSPQWLHIEMRGELTFFLKSKWHEIISPKNYGHGHSNETLENSDQIVTHLDYIWSGQIGIFQMNPNSAYKFAFEDFRFRFN